MVLDISHVFLLQFLCLLKKCLKITYTHGHNIPHSCFSEKHFNSFDSLPIGIEKQMISQLKALVKSI